jgi:hypothetical protein
LGINVASIFTRRELLSYAALSAAALIAGKAKAQSLADLHFSSAAHSELAEVLEQAASMGIVPTAQGRAAAQITRVDLAAIILDALDRSPSSNKAAALAKRAGILLSTLNQVERDLLALEPARRAPPPFDQREKANLKKCFDVCEVTASHKAEIAKAVRIITTPSAKARYQEVADATKVPWYVIGAIHYREANLNFFGHLHNGDRLDRKTRHVPPHRPPGAWPPAPFNPLSAWRLSSIDALRV